MQFIDPSRVLAASLHMRLPQPTYMPSIRHILSLEALSYANCIVFWELMIASMSWKTPWRGLHFLFTSIYNYTRVINNINALSWMGQRSCLFAFLQTDLTILLMNTSVSSSEFQQMCEDTSCAYPIYVCSSMSVFNCVVKDLTVFKCFFYYVNRYTTQWMVTSTQLEVDAPCMCIYSFSSWLQDFLICDHRTLQTVGEHSHLSLFTHLSNTANSLLAQITIHSL